MGLLNIGVEEVKGLEAVREAGRILREESAAAHRLYRLRRRRRHRQGQGRRGGDRRLCRQHRAQDRRGHRAPVRRLSARRDFAVDLVEDRLSVGAAGVSHAARQDGSAQIERRRVPRPQRHRHQEPRRHRRGRLRRRDRHGLRHGALRTARQDRRDHPSPRGRERRGRAPSAERPRDACCVRSFSAAAAICRNASSPTHELARERRHLRRMDRAAHRHPRAPYRRGRRGDLRSRHPRGQGGARQRPCRCAVDRPDRARDLDARQHLPGGGGVGAGRPRHHPRRRLRPAGGVLGLRLWHCDRRRPAAHRHLQARAGDRRGDLLAHPRLDRPHHLRAVRRRRRRRRDGGAAAARHARATAAC